MSAKGVQGTILLVEDDGNDVFLITKALEPFLSRWDLRTVTDGSEAIAYLNGDGPYADRAAFPMPVLVLLDLHLPRVDGLDVLRWIRKQPQLQGQIVIVLTGSDSPRHVQGVYDLHANSYVNKSRVLMLPNAAKDVFKYWLACNQSPASSPALNPVT